MSDLAITTAGAGSATVGVFSYSTLEPAQAEVAQAAANAIRDIHKRAIPSIGRHLLAAKEVLPHGTFTAWAEQELGINARSARNYMQAAKWLMGKPATVAVLPPTVLYALSAPGVPDDLVQGVLVEAASGAPLNPTAIQAKLTAVKAEQVELKAAQRRTPDLTTDELRARKNRRQQREAAERRREDGKRVEEEQGRLTRIAPLAQKVAEELGDALSQELTTVLSDYRDTQAFVSMLGDAVNVMQDQDCRDRNGWAIVHVENFYHNAEHNLGMLAAFLGHLVRGRPWENYQIVTGRRHSSPTLTDLLGDGADRRRAGHGLSLNLEKLRLMLSWFEEGRAALATLDAELAKDALNGAGA